MKAAIAYLMILAMLFMQAFSLLAINARPITIALVLVTTAAAVTMAFAITERKN